MEVDEKQDELEFEVILSCANLRKHMNVSAFVLPPHAGNRIACFGTRENILAMLRDDKQWVEYKGVD
jgi:hypothetical protein